MLTGAYRTTADGIMLKTVTYKTIYPAYIANLQKQIMHFGYKLTCVVVKPPLKHQTKTCIIIA